MLTPRQYACEPLRAEGLARNSTKRDMACFFGCMDQVAFTPGDGAGCGRVRCPHTWLHEALPGVHLPSRPAPGLNCIRMGMRNVISRSEKAAQFHYRTRILT